jgi:DNA mismatch repair protein MutS
VQLADELDAVRNFNVAVREVGDQILFLHRLQPGGADRSYGIEVGRLAGLPAPVLARAKQVLALLEGDGAAMVEGLDRKAGPGPRDRNAGKKSKAPPTDQLALFGALPHPVVEQLRAIDANAMTPLQALELVARLAEQARQA